MIYRLLLKQKFSKLRIIFAISNKFSFFQDIIHVQYCCIYPYTRGSCATSYIVKTCKYMRVQVSQHKGCTCLFVIRKEKKLSILGTESKHYYASKYQRICFYFYIYLAASICKYFC